MLLHDRFLQHVISDGGAAPSTEQLPDMLYQWYAWAVQQSDLSEHEQELCYRPGLPVEQYERARFGEAKFAATTVEGAKYAKY